MDMQEPEEPPQKRVKSEVVWNGSEYQIRPVTKAGEQKVPLTSILSNKHKANQNNTLEQKM